MEYDEKPVKWHGLKGQELLAYLLIHRNRPHPRESLAALLWGDTVTERSKKYLRQTLWHLQNVLKSHDRVDQDEVLRVEDHWVQLNTYSRIWLDIAILEESFVALRDKPGWSINTNERDLLQAAVQVYRGDLLEGSYQDWCLFERERLQNMYLAILYKLMSYCEAHSEFEAGQLYGTLILNYDHASERTHRRLMQLQYMAGDRTAALRQYERCVLALEQDLGVKPEKRTVALYQKIRSGGLELANTAIHTPLSSIKPTSLVLNKLINHLEELELALSDVRRGVSQNIKDIKLALQHVRQSDT